MLMNISFKKRTSFNLISSTGCHYFHASAATNCCPNGRASMRGGLNKLAPHTYVWPYANASDIEKPGGYEQSPFLYEPERKVEIPLGEESR